MNADHPEHESGTRSSQTAVHALFRFLRAARYRKKYIITALLVAGMLGALYYLTATRIYEGNATLLVTQTGGDVWNTRMSREGGSEALMPTYEKLFASDVVLAGALRQLQQLPPEARIDFAGKPQEEWCRTLRNNLSARATRNTNLLEITYRSKSPQAAQATVDAVVRSYLDFMEKNHRDVSFEIVTLLKQEFTQIDARLKLAQQQLLESQNRVRDFGLRSGENIVHPLVQRVITLNDTLVEVQEERLKLQALLAAVNAAKRKGGDLRQHLAAIEPTVGREFVMTALGLNPQFTESMHSVQRKLIEDRARYDMLLEHYGPRYPDVVETARAIRHGEEYVATAQRQLAERMAYIQEHELGPMLHSLIEQQLAAAKAHELELQNEYEQAEISAVGLNNKLVELEMVEREYDRLRRMEDALLSRIETLEMRDDQADVRVAIVGEPAASKRPVSPKLALVGILCIIAGLAAGAGIVYVLELLDDRFRSPEEIKEQLGVPVLAIVRKLIETGQEGIDGLQVHVEPEAVASEAFRTLRTTLAFSGESSERIAVTSSQPGDGKTTILANLAVTFAQAGKRTLLIDADLRRPGLTKLFGMRDGEGVTETIRNDEPIGTACRDRIRFSGIDKLDVLPCGARPTNPAELLGGPRMAELIDWASDSYDQVLVDCPPILAASDAAIVGRMADGMILVVQPDKNHRRTVLRAADGLAALKVNLVGVVANHLGDDKDNDYYGYTYNYGHDELEDAADDPKETPRGEVELPRAA